MSADVFLGVPYNIASYSLLTLMLCQQLNMAPGEFVWTGGDIHIYSNHLDQVRLQLTREPLELCQLKMPEVAPKDLFSYKFEDFELVNYNAHPHIKGDVAV